MRILKILEKAKAGPVANPAAPAPGKGKTFVITFDWAEDSTAGMVDALRIAGIHTATSDLWPRTTLVCRVANSFADATFRRAVSDNLLDDGSAMVAQVGGDVFIWPDKPWPDAKTGKTWRRVTP